MIRFFKEYISGNPSLITTGKESYIFRAIENKLQRVILNIRRSVYTVRSDHLLVQILQHLDTQSNSHNDGDFYRRVIIESERICSAMDITSVNHIQRNTQRGVFYNAPGLHEYYIATPNGYLDSISSREHWMSFQPVKVLYHPFCDLSMRIKDGSKMKSAGRSDLLKNIAVVQIDIPLLALQYRRWREATDNYDVRPTIMQFVYQYPIMNLLYSDTVVNYFNGYSSELGLSDRLPQDTNFGFGLPDADNYVEKQQHDIITKLIDMRSDPVSLMKQIPIPFYSNIYQFLRMGNFKTSATNSGTLALGYLPWLIFTYTLLDLQESQDKTYNVTLRRRIEQYLNMGLFRNMGINQKELVKEINDQLFRYM